MNFLVTGHLCYDEIYLPGREPLAGFGGIYYSVAALAAVAGGGHRVFPVFGVGADMADKLIESLRAFPNVSTDGIYTIGETTNRVKLFFGDDSERIECSESIAPPISAEKVQPFIKRADAVLVNMISGFDITFDMLYMIQEQKKSRNVPVYFDFHSMTLGVDEKNKRYRRPVSEWRRWAFHTTIVQMNEEEAASISIEKLSEDQLARLMMSLGPSAMIITRGSRGASVYNAEKKKVIKTDISGIKTKPNGNNGAGNKTPYPAGCGDVFGAACVFKYAQTGDILESARFANKIASRKAAIESSADLDKLYDPAAEGRD